MANREADMHECDVLVIGGGLAGTWAAIRAKDFADRVILVDKAKVGKSGASVFAAGVMLAPQPGDDLDAWMKEIVERGEYINDQDWVKVMLTEQSSRISELDSWGIPFEKDEKGNIVRMAGRAHINARMLMFHGPRFMHKMREQVLKRGITLIGRVMITDLLTSDGRFPTKGAVVGAIGFHARSGKLQLFKAKSVVVASGSVSGKTFFFSENCTGDGVAMAFRAGAELFGMEFGVPRGGWCFGRKYQMMGMNMFQGNGGILVNRLGERFMEKYEPVLKERARTPVLHLAIAKEGVEGRGPVYMDMTSFTPEVWERCRRVIPKAMRIFDESGLEPWKERIVFDMGTGGIWLQVGGVKHNVYGETNIPGLYVAGQTGGYPAHGTYSVGGVNLASCCVGGHRAGEYAAKYAQQYEPPEMAEEQVRRLEAAAFSPLETKDGVDADTIDRKIRELIHPAAYALFKSEKRIKAVLSGFEEIKGLLHKLSASDSHELVKANEMKNYLLCIELIYRAALERKESRGALSREDYPYRDDINWLKRVILCPQEDAGLDIRLESVPIYRHPVKLEKLERIPPTVPPPKID